MVVSYELRTPRHAEWSSNSVQADLVSIPRPHASRMPHPLSSDVAEQSIPDTAQDVDSRGATRVKRWIDPCRGETSDSETTTKDD